MGSVSREWGIGVTKWQRKNAEDPHRGETFPRSLLYPFLPSWRRSRPSAVTSFRWTPTPTIYLINSTRCPPLRPLRWNKKVTPTSSQIRGRNSRTRRALVFRLPFLVNPRIEKNESSKMHTVQWSIIWITFYFYTWKCFN